MHFDISRIFIDFFKNVLVWEMSVGENVGRVCARRRSVLGDVSGGDMS